MHLLLADKNSEFASGTHCGTVDPTSTEMVASHPAISTCRDRAQAQVSFARPSI